MAVCASSYLESTSGLCVLTTGFSLLALVSKSKIWMISLESQFHIESDNEMFVLAKTKHRDVLTQQLVLLMMHADTGI